MSTEDVTPDKLEQLQKRFSERAKAQKKDERRLLSVVLGGLSFMLLLLLVIAYVNVYTLATIQSNQVTASKDREAQLEEISQANRNLNVCLTRVLQSNQPYTNQCEGDNANH